MIPNPEIYGAPETWQNAYNASGINNAIGTALKCGKIKVPNFNAPNTGTYITSQIRTAVSNNKITANVAIDNTICAVGQGDKSPFKKIACHYYDSDTATWYGPYITDIDTPVNMFPYETYSANGLQGIGGGVTNLNFAALSSGQAQIWSENGVEIKYYNGNPLYYNANWRLAPFTQYQLKSIVLQVYVNYTTNTSDPMTDTGLNEDHWIALDAWKNSYSQYPIVGCKVRMISAYQISGDNIGYYNFVGENNSPYRSAFGLGLNHPIKHNDTDTFMSYTTFKISQIDSDVVIFNKCYNLGGWGKYSKCCLPMWDRFAEYIQKPSNRAVLYRIPYSDDVYEQLMQAVASLGFCFTPTTKTTFGVDFTDADMCIPVIDDNGITTGDYTRGSDNTNNDLYNADSVRDKGYNPDTPPAPVDPNTYSNTTGFNYITEGAAMTVRYVLDGANVDKLLTDLWTINASIAQGGDFEYFDGKIKDEYLTTNPIDCIVSLIRYPFNIPYQLQPLQSYVKLGKTEGSAKGWTTVYIANQINFQGIDIFPRFGDCFLDYEPYTTYELYVPFCGTTKIRAADILGHTLNLTMLIDLITGSCTAYVKADQLVIETLQGSCGVQQQISGTDTATMNANIYNGILAQKQAKAGMIAQGASALLPSNWVNPVGYAAKGEQAEASYKQATFAIEHMETPVHSQGAASPLLGWIQEFDARLMIYYPEGDVIDGAIPPSFKPAPLAAFGHLKGFATVTPGIVGAFRSSNAAFISGDIIADDIPCTLSERNRIKSMFADGVYLPPL